MRGTLGWLWVRRKIRQWKEVLVGKRNSGMEEREGHLPMTRLSLGKYLSTGVLAYTRLEGGMI
jgi:hypothetical protein